jgi:hypothetical protein
LEHSILVSSLVLSISGGLRRNFWEADMPDSGDDRDNDEAETAVTLPEQVAEEAAKPGLGQRQPDPTVPCQNRG